VVTDSIEGDRTLQKFRPRTLWIQDISALMLKVSYGHFGTKEDTSAPGNCRVPTVRESQGILSESGKVRENREGQGKVREF